MSGLFDDAAWTGPLGSPANIQAEMALLGSLLVSNRWVDRCGLLAPEHFSDSDLGRVFAAIRDAVAAGHRIDGVALHGRFDAKLIAALLASMVAHEIVPEYAKVILDCAQARLLIASAQSAIKSAQAGESPSAVAAWLLSEIDRIVHASQPGRMMTLNQAMDLALLSIEAGTIGGVSTGFPTIDDRLGGLKPGLVYVLAGRPGMGKSALAANICINAARDGVGVLAMSLEMSAAQIGQRALAYASGVPMSAMRPGIAVGSAEGLLAVRTGPLADLPFYLDDSAGQTPAMIAAKAREARRKHGVGLLMIDHLNLMRADDADARHGGTWAVGRASNTVLQIAKDCECPVILCVQLNRGPESREDHRPTLADLRQSGDIEQDAFAVGLLYRAQYYISEEPPERREGERAELFEDRRANWHAHKERTHGMADVIWGKVRDGATGVDHFAFDAPTATFREVEP